MHRLEWGRYARADLLSILGWVADDDPDAAERLVSTIDEKIALLARFRELGRSGRVWGTREWVVHRNYVAVYRLQVQTVRVLRVLHVARQWPPG